MLALDLYLAYKVLSLQFMFMQMHWLSTVACTGEKNNIQEQKKSSE